MTLFLFFLLIFHDIYQAVSPSSCNWVLPLCNKSVLCLSISFDNDQLRTILIPTTTASIDSSFADGTRIVLRMSLPTSKSNANNNPLARRSLTVSLSWVCPLGDL